MKKFLISLFLLSIFVLSAQQIVNLGDFIDPGMKDHTAAFKKAFSVKGVKQVNIPSGNYTLSDTIEICGKIAGSGEVKIHMKNPEKDIFHLSHVWNFSISGIMFLGGRNQLVLENNNTDQTFIRIEECYFRQANGFALKFGENTFSSRIVIDKCHFIENMQLMLIKSDLGSLTNSWISTNRKMHDKAVIENYGVLHLENILAVPRVEKVPLKQVSQRWVDNHGTLYCRGVRFGGEGGGFTIVRNYTSAKKKYPVIPNCITLLDCQLYCAQQPAIDFFDVPNRVSVVRCRGLVDAWLMRFRDSVSDKDWNKFTKNHISLKVDDTNGFRQTVLPEFLAPCYSGPQCEIISVKTPEENSAAPSK